MPARDLNGTHYLFTDEFNPESTAETLHGYTRFSPEVPDEMSIPCTLFKTGSVAKSEEWFDHHRLQDHANIVSPVHANREGVAVKGHMLPWKQFCAVLMKYVQQQKAKKMKIKMNPKVENTDWVEFVLPIITKAFCGITQVLTSLHKKNIAHGKLAKGIFVGLNNLNQPFSIANILKYGVRGYVANSTFKRGASLEEISVDRKALFEVMMNVVTFADPKTNLAHIAGLLSKKLRLQDFLTDLAKEESRTKLLGFFAPLFWSPQHEMEFMDKMFHILFRQLSPSLLSLLDGVFSSLKGWENGISDKEMKNVLNHKCEIDEFQNVVKGNYVTLVSFIRFFRNCMEHYPQAGIEPLTTFAVVKRNIKAFDCIQKVYECIGLLLSDAVFLSYMTKSVDDQISELLEKRFVSCSSCF